MERVPIEIQLALWQIIDIRKERGDQMDYLQVFELSVEMVDGEPLQRVLNRQEQPEHTELVSVYNVSQPLDGMTIWGLDSGTYSIMALPEEY
jgi:hypothetical protein